ncbi:MAG: molybdopterin-dependent oxidoreductase [Candidatus Hydrogenedentota bacterium]
MATSGVWKQTACILCGQNCGLEVLVEGREIKKVKGDKSHPISQGYACQKAQQINYYQNDKHRLNSPLRKKEDGTFEEISWDTAIQEIADKFVGIRDEHNGTSIAYFGGGGQGNHLNGAYSGSFRAALGTPYLYTSLAQEKTGGFWVDGKMFGRQNVHPVEDTHKADFLLLIGTNPWQSHGIQQARTLLQAFAKDPDRTLVVVDPVRTESADRADVHLQVKPGGDAHMMLAMLGTIVQEGLQNQKFIDEYTTDFDKIEKLARNIDVDAYCTEAGLDPETVKQVARQYATTKKACMRTDLGLEHSLHSTLNNYLVRLLYIVTGHLGVEGGQVFHTSLLPLIGHSKDPEDGGMTTKVTGVREIGKLYPPNALPLEIDNDHPDRIRAVFVDSGNPVLTGADSRAYYAAFKKLELLVVVDVAMTETARLADYVLPASSQYEKAEATFFNFEFPENFFHLRKPLFEPLEGTLAEAEIYRRLVTAMTDLPDDVEDLETAAKEDRANPGSYTFATALQKASQDNPELQAYAPLVLLNSMGKALPKGMEPAAILWYSTQMSAVKYATELASAGIEDEGAGVADALFNRILDTDTAVIVSKGKYEDLMTNLKHKDGKIHLHIQEMFDEIEALDDVPDDAEFPFVLQAGERRSYNANQIIRSGDWRKKDPDGSLRMNPLDAKSLGVETGDEVEVESARAKISVVVEVSDMYRPGFVSLPHGYGMLEKQGDSWDDVQQMGPSINELSEADHCDDIARTPFHKFIPVRVNALVKA